MWFQWMLVAVCVISQVCGYTDKTVLQCLTDNGLSDFVMLLQNAQVDTTLSGDGPFTVFAPNNAAITSLDPDLMVALSREPVLLKQIVQYHIVADYKVLPQIAAATSLVTMEGQPMYFSGGSVANLVINNSTRLSGAGSDIVCNNGIIHIIDSVLEPPVFSTNNIATVLITRDDLFRDMFMSLLLVNLTHILEASEFTLFAPTDLAFGRYSELNNLKPTMQDASKIYHEVFKYHMVPGRRTKNQLRDGEKLYTLHGYPVDIGVTTNGVTVDQANVVEADIAASNGVIHAIDHVLFPHDLLAQLVTG